MRRTNAIEKIKIAALAYIKQRRANAVREQYLHVLVRDNNGIMLNMTKQG